MPSLLVAVVAASVFAGVAAVSAGAGPAPLLPTKTIVEKTVEGTATGPFTVVVTCTSEEQAVDEWTLNFDSTGAPTTAQPSDWSIVDGKWELSAGIPDGPVSCTATETDADGATNTTWTCEFEDVVGTQDPPGGCDAASGAGTGPVGWTLDTVQDEVESQTTTVHFTNTVNAPTTTTTTPAPVATQPAFTG